MPKKLMPQKKLNLRLLVLLVTGGISFLGVVAGGWLTYTALRDLPTWRIETLHLDAPSTLYAADGTPFATLGFRNYIPVRQNDIPNFVKYAFVGAEDKRFYRHCGIDPVGLARAALSNLFHHRIMQGGSTITQQLAKNAFLVPSRTLKRKIQEIFLAIKLERYYTKDEILTFYLNRIYFGEGAWGIGAAAETYFHKKVSTLTLGEAALLAGMVQAPSYYDPFRNPSEALKRRDYVLYQMLSCRFITPEEYQRARQEPLCLHRGNSLTQEYPYPDFTDYVLMNVEKTYGQRYLLGGFRIYTTLDRGAQQVVEKEVANAANFPPSIRDAQGFLQPQVAVVLVDPATGAVRALVGSRERVAQRQFNRAVQARRQPGSALKPILVYAPAVEFLGMGPQTVVRDEPVRFGSYAPKNYDGRYRGDVTLQDAVAYSINVVAVKVLNQVGLDRATRFAARLGIHVDPAKDGLSAALGGLHRGVTPLEMAAAYAAFANGGEYVEPYVVTRITDAAGNVLEEATPHRYRAMESETAGTIATMLRAAVRYGTGRNARIGTIAAGKTGTTDEGKDLWFCGWVPKLVGVVWMGWDEPHPMPYAYGGKYCARLWRKIMVDALGLTGYAVAVPPEEQQTTPKPQEPAVPPGVYGSVPSETYGQETAPGAESSPGLSPAPPGEGTPPAAPPGQQPVSPLTPGESPPGSAPPPAGLPAATYG
jgi:penicillin-binding protein 1A